MVDIHKDDTPSAKLIWELHSSGTGPAIIKVVKASLDGKKWIDVSHGWSRFPEEFSIAERAGIVFGYYKSGYKSRSHILLLFQC
jgi:hypothetical protein